MTLPAGTLTFVFTDIEGSTPLRDTYPEEMMRAQQRHNELISHFVELHQGTIVQAQAEGDSTFSVFQDPACALEAICDIQRALYREPWPDHTPIRVRAALHTGAASLKDNQYYGTAVNRCARLLAIGHGGQTLLSQATYLHVQEAAIPDGIGFRDMGSHKLKGLKTPERVYQVILKGLPIDRRPLTSLASGVLGNLPEPPNSLIGRKQDLSYIKRLILAPSKRLITLTGSGGCGKTRLALQAAKNIKSYFEDGVWLVKLEELTDPSRVVSAVTSALLIREETGQPLTETLVAYLRYKSLLLVLDNCEHLIGPCACLVTTLLQKCSKLKVLATSREAFKTTEEHAWRVPSLPAPDPEHMPSLEALTDYEAVRFLVERIKGKEPHFRVTAKNAAAVAKICHRLDGIPLALELAAARISMMPIEEISTRLDNCFRVLTGGSPTALPRQQTMKATLDWSYDLLNEQEQLLLNRSSIFVGGWTLKAIETICSGDGINETEVADSLRGLIDKSMVLYPQREGVERYRLIEPVRQYAREKLSPLLPEQTCLHRRHLDYFLTFAEKASDHIKGEDAVAWLSLLDADHNNLRAALEWSRSDAGSATACLRMANALWRFWYVRGHLSEGREWLTRALAAAGDDAPQALRAEALFGAATLAVSQGDYQIAQDLSEQSIKIKKELGDHPGIADSLQTLGALARFRCDIARARSLFEECLEIRQETLKQLEDTAAPADLGLKKIKKGIADVGFWLGNLERIDVDDTKAYSDYDFTKAHSYYSTSLAMYTELGIEDAICDALHNLGLCAHEKAICDALHNLDLCAHEQRPDHYKSARHYYAGSLRISRRLKLKARIAKTLNNSGNLSREMSKYAKARFRLEKSLALYRELGDRPGIAATLWNLAVVSVYHNDYDLAYKYFKESLEKYLVLKSDPGIATCLEGFATLMAARKKFGNAAVLLGRAAVMWQDAAASRDLGDQIVYHRTLAIIRVSLDDDVYNSARERGRTMTLEEAKALALNQNTNGGSPP